jgi:hypothetical protein
MPKDLIILVADSDMRAAIEGLLERPAAIPIRAITFDVIVHPQRDPGVRLRSRELLATYRSSNSFAVAMLDHEGCGASADPDKIELQIEAACQIDWSDRIRAIAISPELEAWVWSDSPQVDAALGWTAQDIDLRQWLVDSGWITNRNDKPQRPKEAFDAAIRSVRKPRSSTIFKSLGKSVGLNRCQDRSFLRLRQSLQAWFPLP